MKKFLTIFWMGFWRLSLTMVIFASGLWLIISFDLAAHLFLAIILFLVIMFVGIVAYDAKVEKR
jgi:hypothetical protein